MSAVKPGVLIERLLSLSWSRASLAAGYPIPTATVAQATFLCRTTMSARVYGAAMPRTLPTTRRQDAALLDAAGPAGPRCANNHVIAHLLRGDTGAEPPSARRAVLRLRSV